MWEDMCSLSLSWRLWTRTGFQATASCNTMHCKLPRRFGAQLPACMTGGTGGAGAVWSVVAITAFTYSKGEVAVGYKEHCVSLMHLMQILSTMQWLYACRRGGGW